MYILVAMHINEDYSIQKQVGSRKPLTKNIPELSREVESGLELVGLFPNMDDPTAPSNRRHLFHSEDQISGARYAFLELY